MLSAGMLENSYYNRLKKDFREKIGDRTIQEWGLYMKSVNDLSFHIKHTGTVFKLYSLYEYLTWPYLSIIANQRSKRQPYKMVYLDLFAGSGLNQFNDDMGRKYFIAGSPILAILASFKMSQLRKHYNCYFDNMVLIDGKQSNTGVLFDRCQAIIDKLGIQSSLSVGNGYDSGTNIQIINTDVTKPGFLHTLMHNLDKIQNSGKIHLMVFIDPPAPSSLELPMLGDILSYPSDVIMLLHSGIFATQVKKQIYNTSTLEKILGISSKEAEDLLQSNYSQQYLESYYTSKFKQKVSSIEIGISSGSQFREITIVVPIKTTMSNYNLMYATRKTGGNSEDWQRPAETFARWMGKLSDAGPTAISVLQGSQSRLEDFS